MSKIIIKEYNKVKEANNAYENFAVLVPGFCVVGNDDGVTKKAGIITDPTNPHYREYFNGIKYTKVFDENGVYECKYQSDFINYIGPVIQKKKDQIIHYGNQIAYELLGMGYTVYYKYLDENTYYDVSTGEIHAQESEHKNSDLVSVNVLKASWFWKELEDKSAYNIRYIISGIVNTLNIKESTTASPKDINITPNEVIKKIAELANNRNDCIALCDLNKGIYSKMAPQATIIEDIKTNINSFLNDDKNINQYCALLAPVVNYDITYTGDVATYEGNKLFPASFHYLACAAKAKENSYAEWYANAGYNRGVSKYTISSVGYKFGEAAIDALQPRYYDDTQTGNEYKKAVNLIIKIKDQYYLWGNRTALDLGSAKAKTDLIASHFLNIRQLCCTLKKTIYQACKQFTFDPNSDLLWINFCSAITPTLDKMKSDQGIVDYELIKEETDIKAFFKAKVRIVPIEAVEEFEIGISLEDSLSGNVEFSE